MVLLPETSGTQMDDYKRTLFNMESVCILVQELLTAYKDDNEVIQSFLTELTHEEMDEVKAEIDNFILHISEVETALTLDRQEL